MPPNDYALPPDAASPNQGGLNSSSPADYFQRARAAFAEAVQRGGLQEKKFQIGGGTFRLRLADETLAPVILPALAHLAIETVTSPDLKISLADMTSSKIALRFPGSEFSSNEPIGAMRRYHDARFFALAQKETDALSLLDAETDEAFYWTQNAARLPWQENTFPLRHLLAHFFRRREQQLIHAAAVGNENGAVLIAGKGGSGKSTATLACATHGLFYLGDDYTLAGVEPEPRVWSLYSSAKVNADTLNWFPQLKPFVHHTGGAAEKSSLFLHGAPDLRFAGSLPIRAVLWPRITGRAETKLTPASSATLLLALAPSSILQTPGDGEAVLRTLGRLVQAVPAFVLEAGTNPAAIAAAIKKFLAT